MRVVLMVAVLCFTQASTGRADQGPSGVLVPIQGYLETAAGMPVNGSTTLTFELHDASMPGTTVYSETQSVSISGGQFVAYLGQVTMLPAAAMRDQLRKADLVRRNVDDEKPRLGRRPRVVDDGEDLGAGDRPGPDGATPRLERGRQSRVRAARNLGLQRGARRRGRKRKDGGEQEDVRHLSG